MLVSVIIPTFNRANLLNEAIESVNNQTYRPIECIVVDDGSTGDTRNIVNELIKRNSVSFMIKYIYQPNSGSQVARNTGTAAASGEFIQYLDSDDLLYPHKIKNQVEYFIDHPECDAVFGDWEQGSINDKKQIKAFKSEDLLKQFLTQKPIAVFAMLMRCSLIERIGAWDVAIKRNQEIDFHLRGVLAEGKFAYQPQQCGLWRLHENERIGNATKFSDAINFYRKWEDIFKEQQLWDESYKRGVVNNYMWFMGNYFNSETNQMAQLLKEIQRLQPSHPIFCTPKFKVLKAFTGFEIALSFWIRNYKRNLAKNNG